MSSLLTVLSENEIEEQTELGKGCNLVHLALCASGRDSGTCTNVFKQCGYKPGGNKPKPPCNGSPCTCR